MGGGHKPRRGISPQNQRKQQGIRKDDGWLLSACITAFAAGSLVALGHWFSSTQGRRLGSDKRRYFLRGQADDVQDEESKRKKNQANPKSLAELRLRRLQAAEARVHSTRTEPSAARLTPLGVILELGQKVDKLDEEAKSFLADVSSRIMTPSEEKAQMQLLESLGSLQLDIDAVQGDESVRPHKRTQTNRVQTLLAKLDCLNHHEVSTGPVLTDVGSPHV